MAFLYLIFFFLSAKLIWRLVLKKSAYPSSIPPGVKIIHAIILLYVILNAFCNVNLAFGLLFNRELSGLESPFLTVIIIVGGALGVYLLFVCSSMAKREQRSLMLYFTLWPLMYTCSICVAVVREYNRVRLQHLVVGVVLLTIPFLISLIFYCVPKAKILFHKEGGPYY